MNQSRTLVLYSLKSILTKCTVSQFSYYEAYTEASLREIAASQPTVSISENLKPEVC